MQVLNTERQIVYPTSLCLELIKNPFQKKKRCHSEACLDNFLVCCSCLNFSEPHTASLAPLSLCFCQFSLRSCIFGFPASLLHPNMFISNCPSPFTTCFYQLFSQSTTKQREERLTACGGLTQPGTLSMNFSASPSPSVIDKQSFPYAVDGVMALTEGGMLWGENIVQQWHRSNLGLAEWFHQGLLLPQSVWPRGPCQPCC